MDYEAYFKNPVLFGPTVRRYINILVGRYLVVDGRAKNYSDFSRFVFDEYYRMVICYTLAQQALGMVVKYKTEFGDDVESMAQATIDNLVMTKQDQIWEKICNTLEIGLMWEFKG